MDTIVNTLMDTSNETVIVFCLILAVFRIYLELINFNFAELPLTKLLGNKTSTAYMQSFHRTGLYLSIGYVVLFAPSLLFS
jgi:hypothetical protein